MTDERTLAFLRELERVDEETSTTLAELDDLAAEVERIRSRTLELVELRERASTELAAAPAAVSAAEEEVAKRRAQLDHAASDDPSSERTRVRAQDSLRLAERRLRAARAEAERLQSETAAAERETTDLGSRARAVARSLRARPGLAAAAGREPAPPLDGLGAWATDARAALFVARGNLAREREALIRQANELGALIVGPSFAAESPAAAARRIQNPS